MITHVIQSASPDARPEWLARCLVSVKTWARDRDWTYSCSGDDLFEYVPGEICEKFARQKPLLADIARLNWARRLFDDNANLERVIWMDADVIIFAPDKVEIDPSWDLAVGRQVWIQPDGQGGLKTYRQVHNATLVIHRDSPALDYLRHAAMKIAAQHDGPAASQLLGPKLLTALHNITAFDVVESVGMASPLVIRDIISGGGDALTLLRNGTNGDLGAVNLCASYRGRNIDGVHLSDADFLTCVERLCAAKSL